MAARAPNKITQWQSIIARLLYDRKHHAASISDIQKSLQGKTIPIKTIIRSMLGHGYIQSLPNGRIILTERGKTIAHLIIPPFHGGIKEGLLIFPPFHGRN